MDEVRYARNGDVHIAYRVMGEGPMDLVYAPGIWSNLEIMWEDPRWARFMDRLASFSRLIVFDMRGIGLSDRGPEPPVIELQMDDVRAVMDAAGSENAAVFGVARGAASAALFAATYPERTNALIMYASLVRTLQAPDFPFGWTDDYAEHFYERWVREMGTGENLDLQAPSVYEDAAFKRWWARFERLVATPQAFRELGEVVQLIDVRSVLPHIQAPTLVLHRTGDRIPKVEQGRYIAEQIPGARFVELAGDDHLPFIGDQDSSSTRSRSSSRGHGMRWTPTGSWRRSCSPTSSARPTVWPKWETRAGGTCSWHTTPLCGVSSMRFAGSKSTRRATGSWLGSTALPEPSDVPG